MKYQLFYINGENRLQGDILQILLSNKSRDELLFYFARYLSEKYNNLDIIDVFNTFQKFTQGYLEKIGFKTITSIEYEKLIDQNPIILAKGVRGIIPIHLLDKAEFYSKFMNEDKVNRENCDSTHIYLMLNKKSGSIKIGRSKNPSFREKTLQAEQPDLELISIWEAPKKVENELHKKYSDKRIRGEWFNLTFNDLKDIKDCMKKYE